MILPDSSFWRSVIVAIWCCGYIAHADLEVVDTGLQRIFPGKRNFEVRFRNPADVTFSSPIVIRVYQTSSSTGALLSETQWKQLQVPGQQTVIESAQLTFPNVKAETHFVMQWIARGGTILGKTELVVYPVDLLQRLRFLSGEHPLGIFDPQHQLRGPLHAAGVEFQLLGAQQIENFSGKLLIGWNWTKAHGPTTNLTASPERNVIRELAARGVGIIWIESSPVEPSFYSFAVGKGCVVVAGSKMVANLADNPATQLNLIRMAQFALKPELLLPQF